MDDLFAYIPPEPNQLRSGIAIGGFYDGKNLYHHSDIRWVAWRVGEERRGPITYVVPATNEIYYTQYRFRDGVWHHTEDLT